MMIIDHPGSPFGELVLQVLVVDAAISLGARVPALQAHVTADAFCSRTTHV
jgi:hypothetical protein